MNLEQIFGIGIMLIISAGILLLIFWTYTQTWNRHIGKKEQSFLEWILNRDAKRGNSE